jgi:hypothetical protein
LREELRLRALRRIFGPKREKILGRWRNCVMIRPIMCIPHRCYQNDQMKEGHVAYMGKKSVRSFGGEHPKDRDH